MKKKSAIIRNWPTERPLCLSQSIQDMQYLLNTILTCTAIPFSHFPTYLLPFEKNRVPSPWNLHGGNEKNILWSPLFTVKNFYFASVLKLVVYSKSHGNGNRRTRPRWALVNFAWHSILVAFALALLYLYFARSVQLPLRLMLCLDKIRLFGWTKY